MANWYNKVTEDINDLSPLIECLEFYENELIRARMDLKVSGRLEQISKLLPTIAELRYNQLQDLEAILKFLNIRYDMIKGAAYKKYLEKYDRALSSRDAEKYAECDQDVYDMALLVNKVALIRNQFLGVTKGVEYLHFQVSNCIKLRVAGMEDATL